MASQLREAQIADLFQATNSRYVHFTRNSTIIPTPAKWSVNHFATPLVPTSFIPAASAAQTKPPSLPSLFGAIRSAAHAKLLHPDMLSPNPSSIEGETDGR